MELFGTPHLAILFLGSIAGALLIALRRLGKRWPVALLAFLNLTAFSYNQLVYSNLGYAIPFDNILPFHLCDIASFVAAIALLTRHPLACELCYCWGLAGTLQALITPNLPYPFPHPMFFSFFVQHGVIVITALFLPLGERWSPRPGTFPRIILWNQIYFLLALTVNWIAGTNFGFLMRKPLGATPFDFLGPWPWYWIPLQLLAGLLMALTLIPFAKRINVWRFA